MKQSSLKEELFHALNYEAEFNDLLGSGTGSVRSCFNKAAHKAADQNASLSFDKQTGSWKCHACGEKGDLFTLYKRVKQLDFSQSFTLLLKRYGLWEKIRDVGKLRANKGPESTQSVLQDPNTIALLIDGMARWKTNPSKLEWMLRRYGLTFETLIRWSIALGRNDTRVYIPTWQRNSGFNAKDRATPTMRLSSMVNIRKHDCFRLYAKWFNTETKLLSERRPAEITDDMIIEQSLGVWQPVYGQSNSKVLSIKGFGSTYLYPFEVLLENPSVYLTGGELKALLLNQLGLPAITFTAGEGAYNEVFLPYFIGKRVRVLMDIDEAGLRATNDIAQVLANHGAYVEKVVWPDDVRGFLPSKGDVTDYLKACQWKPEALDYLGWEEVQAQDMTEMEDLHPEIISLGMKEVSWVDMPQVKFHNIVEPGNLRKWMRTNALIAGRGETPFAIPRKANITCEEGRVRFKTVCTGCRLPTTGFRAAVELTVEGQLELVGMPVKEVNRLLLNETGIPRNCPFPQVDVINSAVEEVVLTPTVDLKDHLGQDGSDDGVFQYAHRKAYILQEQRIDVEENRSYDLGGKILPDPKHGRFTFGIRDFRPVGDDILKYVPDQTKWYRLQKVLGVEEGHEAEAVSRLVTQLSDHVTHIYEQDEMTRTILLSFFLPFYFRIGHYENERICPSVLILGDTNVGKSTATKRLLRHFSGGRYASADSNPTFAGIIGGNLQSGSNKMTFSWGLMPTSHRALLAMDEYNKLPLDVIGALSNTVTSGIAERVTANGIRRTLCHVRLLYLANPRGERRLTSYSDPLEAAQRVMGAVQDLGRVEYVHIQFGLRNTEVYNELRPTPAPITYTTTVARFHLQWAWGLNGQHIDIEDPEHLLGLAKTIADRYQGHPLLLPAQIRFKLGRFAIGFATLLASANPEHPDTGVLVKRVHTQLAYDMFIENYDQWIAPAKNMSFGSMFLLPREILGLLNKVSKVKDLRFLATSNSWSYEDLEDAFGSHGGAKDFISAAQFEHGLITRHKTRFYPKDSTNWAEGIEGYINERDKAEEAERMSRRQAKDRS